MELFREAAIMWSCGGERDPETLDTKNISIGGLSTQIKFKHGLMCVAQNHGRSEGVGGVRLPTGPSPVQGEVSQQQGRFASSHSQNLLKMES